MPANRLVLKHPRREVAAGYPTTTRRRRRTSRLRPKKDLQMQAFCEAAEGIRTLDLLHGKQNVWSRLGADLPCKSAGSHMCVSSSDSTAFTGSSRRFRHPLGTRCEPRQPGEWTRARRGGASARARRGPIARWPTPGPSPQQTPKLTLETAPFRAKAIVDHQLRSHACCSS